MKKRDYLVEVEIDLKEPIKEEVVNGIICRPAKHHTLTVSARSELEAINAIRSELCHYTGKIVSVFTMA